MVIGSSPIPRMRTRSCKKDKRCSLPCQHQHQHHLRFPFISPPPLLLLLLLSVAAQRVGATQNAKIDISNGVKFPMVNEHEQEYHLRKMQAFKASLLLQKDSPSPHSGPLVSPSPSPVPASASPRVFRVTSYGADPTGNSDSTDALLTAFADAATATSQLSGSAATDSKFLMSGITNSGGAQIHLEGGRYLVRHPLRFPVSGAGNMLIHGGTLEASDDFPKDGYLIDLSHPSPSNQNEKLDTNKTAAASSSSSYNYEYITLRDIMLDCRFRGGGISVINSLRTGIDNLYIAHFTTHGIFVRSGHETMIRNSYLGQHITAGGDPDEKDFSGTGISLAGNDNVVSDVIVFSAATGIVVSGQANLLSGVHCYNKATGFGGIGIHLKIQGPSQTRIVNSYMDYTGIVAEDPVQLVMSGNFFLGDAFITLKSVRGVARGVNIVDNIFSGSGKGIDIVRLDQTKGPFRDVDQVVVDRNNVQGMNAKATVAKATVEGDGTSSWSADFNRVLLFPNLIKRVQYTHRTSGNSFPNFALRNMTDNRVLIQSDVAANSTVYIAVDQGG